ncbi:MAG: hypothetical protein Ta2E_12690 [Mycoplasmoidaceae bacterium]|nr:MAG: hypothetical protein Ta2E_12690 [Mycoplasmoidaceae bacterium]
MKKQAVCKGNGFDDFGIPKRVQNIFPYGENLGISEFYAKVIKLVEDVLVKDGNSKKENKRSLYFI